MTPNAALIEAMARGMSNNPGDDREMLRWYAERALDALLAVRCTSPCPEKDCDAGLIYYGTDDHGGAEPCQSCDGSGSVDTGPAVLLADELEQVGWHTHYDGLVALEWTCSDVYRERSNPVPVFILRPRPEPEETT